MRSASSRRRGWRGALGLGLGLACASAEPVAPVAAPQPSGPPLPAELDLAVRVDVASLGAELGHDLARRFLLDALGAGEESSRALLGRSLDHSTLIWWALPSAAEPAPVLVLRGHFGELDAATADGDRWSRQAGGVEALDLPSVMREGRDEPGYARLYRLPGDEILVWTPRAEVERIERAIQGRSAPAELLPPERGAVSVAARPTSLLARHGGRFPELAERFGDLSAIAAFAEPGGGGWHADLSLDFDSAPSAVGAADVLERLAEALGRGECAIAIVARAVSVSTFEQNVRVRAALSGPALEALEACVLGAGCCA